MNDLTIDDNRSLAITTDNEWILHRIDEIIEDALKQNDVTIALDAGRDFVRVAKVAGLGMAKLLYNIFAHWDEFGMEEGSFDEIVYAEIGLDKHTVNRYIRVWAMYAEHVIPDKYEQEIIQLNIRDQIPIANALAQGYEFSTDNWQAIVDAPDGNTVAKIVQQDVRGKPPRKSSLAISMDSDGSIWVTKGGVKEFVGSLEIDSDELIVKQAIERIVKNTGILT